MDAILDAMERLRALAKARFPAQPTRRRFLRRCLDAMLAQGSALTDAQAAEILAETGREI